MIRVQNLSKHYQSANVQITVLENINFEISSGEFCILKGISGSGKTTLLSLIAGFEKPSEGVVYIANEPISKLPDLHQSKLRNEKIGFVFQSFNLFEDMSVHDNVTIPLIPRRLQSDAVEAKIKKALELANIAHKKDEIVYNLSGGEKQRCAIARALVNSPQILICDEPTANLDKANTQTFIQMMQKLKNEGKTILIATHDPIFETLDFIDRVLYMDEGKIIEA